MGDPQIVQQFVQAFFQVGAFQGFTLCIGLQLKDGPHVLGDGQLAKN